MQSKAATVEQYLASLPDDRRAALSAVRQVILENLDGEIAERMQYGMIGYFIPHSVYPTGYHCDPKQPLPYAGLASQKNHMALYLMCIYGSPSEAEWFRKAWAKTGRKLDMGRSCVRFKKLEDIPLEVIGEAFRRIPAREYIRYYEASIGRSSASKPAAAKKAAAKSAAPKKAAPERAAPKKKPAPGKPPAKSSAARARA